MEATRKNSKERKDRKEGDRGNKRRQGKSESKGQIIKDEFFRIEVETYSGYKGAERPIAFIFKGRRIRCEEISDRWYGEGHEYFRVKGDDSLTYILRYDRHDDFWELSAMTK